MLYIHNPFSINKNPKTKSDALLRPEARPSIPSIRLIALVIKTTVIIVKGIPNHAGIILTPNRP